MEVQVEQLAPCRVALHIEIDAERVKAVQNRAFNEVSPHVSVPGFRPGKAPRNLIQRYMNQDLLRRHTLSLLVPPALKEAVKEAQIDPYDDPTIDTEPELVADQPLKFVAEISTQPHVQLGEYTGLRIEFSPFVIRDEDVVESLETLRVQRQTLQAVDRPAEEGDYVAIDYLLKAESEEDRSGPMLRVAGSSDHPLDQAVLGRSAGETLTVDGPLGDHPDRSGVYEVTIKEVRNWVLPDLDDDFAKSAGLDSLSELEASVRSRLERQASEMSLSDVQDRLLAAARGQATIVYPEEMVERVAGQNMDVLLQELHQRRLTLDSYLAHEGITLERLRDQIEDKARGMIENQLMLAQIARDQRLRATEAEIAEALGAESADPDEQEEAAGLHDRIASRIVFQKVMQFLAENNDLVPTGGQDTDSAGEGAESDVAESGTAERESSADAGAGWAGRLFRRRGPADAGDSEAKESD